MYVLCPADGDPWQPGGGGGQCAGQTGTHHRGEHTGGGRGIAGFRVVLKMAILVVLRLVVVTFVSSTIFLNFVPLIFINATLIQEAIALAIFCF